MREWEQCCGGSDVGKGMEHQRLQEKPRKVEAHAHKCEGRDVELENEEGPNHSGSPRLGWGFGII